MTGYGAASYEEKKLLIKTEIRSTNHRFFNLKLNLPDLLARYESEVETLIKKFIRRGSVHLNVKATTALEQKVYKFNSRILRHYYQRLKRFQKSLVMKDAITLDTLLGLPGVWEPEEKLDGSAQKVWVKVKKVLNVALKNILRMRHREGQRIGLMFKKGINKMQAILKKIESHAPCVISSHEKSLKERLKKSLNSRESRQLLKNQNLNSELLVFAQRCDITEETQRLFSHVKEFIRTMNGKDEAGKRLEFITQEMLREANTMASKANNTRIAHWAIDLKTEIERLKEQIQNIE